MKRYLLALITCTIAASLYADPQEVYSHTFMFPRPAYDHILMHQQLWHNIIYSKKGTIRGSMQATVFGQQTRKESYKDSKFARYFLTERKNRLRVAGDNVENEIDKIKRDVRAEWLGLPSNFQGELLLNPEQRQVGFVFEYNQDISSIISLPFFEDSYIAISVPFVHAKHDLNLRQENIQNPGTTGPRDILEAFKQPNWHYDKIDGSQSRHAFTQIQVRMGRAFKDDNDNQLAYYTSLIIPTTKAPNPEFLFNAMVGNGRHVGINAGVNLQARLNGDDCPNAWMWFGNLDVTFLIRNKQFRTFDLKDKANGKPRPWSRFLLFNTENEPMWSNIPGVNVLTLEAIVRPYGQFDFSTGIRFKTDCFEGELGYSIWGHDDERVELREPFITDKGIAGNTDSTSASLSTVAQQLSNDAMTFVRIKESDIDLRSAAAASALNHTLHFAGGVHHEGNAMATFMGAGAYVEWAQKNRPLNVWGIWGKIGFSF